MPEINEIDVKKVVHEILPRILREHPETRFEIERLIRETAMTREEAESRFERLLEENI
ncbi:hypothetical protein [Thermosulfurimonas sp.]|uniref:hypothetical protein n=1 Tax=Thermosulfurimonas sp. TaxID=2080236 RepID=UPI0025F3BC82|nr:hypothetical protein [Thermosulfurimonas sp.]